MQQAINKILSLTLCAIWLLIIAQITLAQTTQFTYQGKLSDSVAPAAPPERAGLLPRDGKQRGHTQYKLCSLPLTHLLLTARR